MAHYRYDTKCYLYLFSYSGWPTTNCCWQRGDDWVFPSLSTKDQAELEWWPHLVLCGSQTSTESLHQSTKSIMLPLLALHKYGSQCHVLWCSSNRTKQKSIFHGALCTYTRTGWFKIMLFQSATVSFDWSLYMDRLECDGGPDWKDILF